jgi:hypothetical protein
MVDVHPTSTILIVDGEPGALQALASYSASQVML